MKILVTGALGFVGRNLVERLKNLQNGNDRTRPGLSIEEIMKFDRSTEETALPDFCARADFVFHLAGVNRPEREGEFEEVNVGFSDRLLELLKENENTCPVMLSSSTQAALTGRFAGSPYGKSKKAGEELFFRYAKETGAKVLVYRFPNLFGKWCRPNYNSAVATFCNAFANDLPYTVNDPSTELTLVYIDDLVNEMLDALEGKENRCDFDGTEPVTGDGTGQYCFVPVSHKATLGEIVALLGSFSEMSKTLFMPEIPEGSFAKKLFSTYLSYLPAEKLSYGFHSNIDSRGNFTELIRTHRSGQVSVNVAKPGNTRGQHWHNSKWEIFIVVHGHGLIRERRIGVDPETGEAYPVIEFEVTGEEMRAVQMLPGYAHSITNLSDTEDLVTIMWANETFDETHPDTFHETV